MEALSLNEVFYGYKPLSEGKMASIRLLVRNILSNAFL